MGGASTFGAGAVVRRVERVDFRRLDDELIAIDANGGFCFSLNESAARVWESMAEPIAVAELCARARAGYAVGEAACEADVHDLLVQLRDVGLVEIEGA
jgi:hypothetical protein